MKNQLFDFPNMDEVAVEPAGVVTLRICKQELHGSALASALAILTRFLRFFYVPSVRW
jgi:hypothetical protein